MSSDESELLNEIAEIAERGLWKPENLDAIEIQKMAAVIVAFARRYRSPPGAMANGDDRRDGAR